MLGHGEHAAQVDARQPRRRFRRGRLADSMLGWPRPAKRGLMIAADLLVVPAALWAAFALKFDSWSVGFERNIYFYVGVAASSTLIFAASGLYRAVVRYIGLRVLISILAGVTSAAVVLWAIGETPFVNKIPASVVAIFWLLALVWVGATRVIARWALTPQRYEIDDYGDAAWSGGSLPAASVIVYFSLTAAGKPTPETNCMIFAWLDDAATGARREPAAFRCDALSDVERWKRQRALKSRWS